MEEEFPRFIEVVPSIKGVKCKFLMYLIYGALTFSPLLIGGWVGYTYNIWIGIAFFLFLTLVSGVVSSKMRASSIPPAQREMDYSTMAIVKWYLSRSTCW
jgi:zinc transporter ZupT